ncbi:uncharacterized protein [Amphiura filiformis]|uniref:uncharacterized protein n=1 Tax=Amphiura filiformis TaxID=82378 RepID=UPI003B21A7B6
MSSGPKPGPPHPSTSTPASNGGPSLMSAYFPQQLQTTTKNNEAKLKDYDYLDDLTIKLYGRSIIAIVIISHNYFVFLPTQHIWLLQIINWLNKQVSYIEDLLECLMQHHQEVHKLLINMLLHLQSPVLPPSHAASRPWSTSVMTYSLTIPPIPEEISPTPRSTITRPAAVLSSEPALDMKYLQQKHQQVGFQQPRGPFSDKAFKFGLRNDKMPTTKNS